MVSSYLSSLRRLKNRRKSLSKFSYLVSIDVSFSKFFLLRLNVYLKTTIDLVDPEANEILSSAGVVLIQNNKTLFDLLISDGKLRVSSMVW